MIEDDWLERLASVGLAEKTTFVDSSTESSPLSPPLTKIDTPEKFFANPPETFTYDDDLGLVTGTLEADLEDRVIYVMRIPTRPRYVRVIHVFKYQSEEHRHYVEAYKLRRPERIICFHANFTDNFLRNYRFDWSINSFKQFGFKPYDYFR